MIDLEDRLVEDESAYERFRAYRLTRLDGTDRDRAVVMMYERPGPNLAYVIFEDIDDHHAHDVRRCLMGKREFEPEDYDIYVLTRARFLDLIGTLREEPN